jgi:hypothetical protein
MGAAVPESGHWMSNFGLAVIFLDFPPAEMRPFVINFIRRIQAAFLEYGLARQEVFKLIKDGNGRWSPYFAALTHFEVAVSQLYLALDAVRKRSNHNFFRTGDASFEENLNLIYNASKHHLAETQLPVWFSNDGLSCLEAEVTFAEVEDFMLKMAGVVKGLCNREIAVQAIADVNTTPNQRFKRTGA